MYIARAWRLDPVSCTGFLTNASTRMLPWAYAQVLVPCGFAWPWPAVFPHWPPGAVFFYAPPRPPPCAAPRGVRSGSLAPGLQARVSSFYPLLSYSPPAGGWAWFSRSISVGHLVYNLSGGCAARGYCVLRSLLLRHSPHDSPPRPPTFSLLTPSLAPPSSSAALLLCPSTPPLVAFAFAPW
jgi:hypothetical protein